MKKVLSLILICSACALSFNTVKAQTALKIGVFDMDAMVQAMPEYRGIDSLSQVYNRDSIGADYTFYQSEYQRLDSIYKADSAAKKPASVLNYTKGQLQQIAFNLVYWNQISQQRSQEYMAKISQPLYIKVATAYRKVLTSAKVDIVLKPAAFELGTNNKIVENLFPLVAKELGVSLPDGYDQPIGDLSQLDKISAEPAMPAAGAKP